MTRSVRLSVCPSVVNIRAFGRGRRCTFCGQTATETALLGGGVDLTSTKKLHVPGSERAIDDACFRQNNTIVVSMSPNAQLLWLALSPDMLSPCSVSQSAAANVLVSSGLSTFCTVCSAVCCTLSIIHRRARYMSSLVTNPNFN